MDGTNAIFPILMCSGFSPKQTIRKDSHLKTFLRNSRIFHFSSEHSHNLQFHILGSACKLGPDLS